MYSIIIGTINVIVAKIRELKVIFLHSPKKKKHFSQKLNNFIK